MWGESTLGEDRTSCSPGYLRRQVKNLKLYQREADPKVEQWWDQAEQQLLEFDAACREAGTAWMLLVAPAEIQVDPQVRAEVLAHAPESAEAYDFEGPERRLAAFAAKHGIMTVDPLEALRSLQDRKQTRLYIPNNGHWNAVGNDAISGILAEKMRGLFDDGLKSP